MTKSRKADLFSIVSAISQDSSFEFSQKDILQTIYYLTDCLDRESDLKRVAYYVNGELEDRK